MASDLGLHYLLMSQGLYGLMSETLYASSDIQTSFSVLRIPILLGRKGSENWHRPSDCVDMHWMQIITYMS